ncbi:hypothetical protein FYC62_14540 [Pedobacter aquae]|uniref:Lipoprotein n=1 Tax=Pedobacter aquae TaxID=2605747 RepID=A0A5C0VN57_9SPHI|nr:hypothetical protein [Pedobacter aquae]QEK52740.1 hypothetical protein FYC62_14540 [Pedobacter aquae]
MKNSRLLLFSLIVATLTFSGCDKQETDCGFLSFETVDFRNYPSLGIVNGDEEDKYLVINSKAEFDEKVFISEEDKERFHLDYNKYTLLLGKKRIGGIPGGLISQTWQKECGSTNYIYKVDIKNGGYTALGNFYFGIIVDKVSADEVMFDVNLSE